MIRKGENMNHEYIELITMLLNETSYCEKPCHYVIT